MQTIQVALGAVAFILLFDVLMFLAWAMSGQSPVDGFFFGAITNALIN